ncbi:MAG TPA: MFS transporter [Anaerolineae bacterium]
MSKLEESKSISGNQMVTDRERDYKSIARKITWALFANQALASTGLIAFAVVAPIVGVQLVQETSLAGLPTAVSQVAGALTAFLWGFLMDRLGRRTGLVLGSASGILGALLAITAIIIGSFALFLFSMVFLGASNSAVQLSRFVAAEVNLPEARGRAIANVVLGGSVGAILSYVLVSPLGDLMKSSGFDQFTGAFVLTFIMFVLSAIVLSSALRPEPREIGRELGRLHPGPSGNAGTVRPLREILRVPAVVTAMTAMILGHFVMVLVMVITSVHMQQHAHNLRDITMVMSLHTIGMFAFSVFSGRLADRWGRGPVIMVGALGLAFASIGATLSPDVFPLAASLFLLGLGWNFCFVGGSSLFADQLSHAERARTQGFNDLLLGAAAALGSISSGLIFSAVGYNTLGIIAAIAAFVPLSLTTWWQLTHAQVINARSSIGSQH